MRRHGEPDGDRPPGRPTHRVLLRRPWPAHPGGASRRERGPPGVRRPREPDVGDRFGGRCDLLLLRRSRTSVSTA
nr:hypothetical protein [Streptomyces nodosus]